MFDFVFVLCCKDIIKSNIHQIKCGKSYEKAYYLTFVNIKIKEYYYFMYYFSRHRYYILYVSCYIIYLIIYRERNKASREGKRRQQTGQEEREPGRRMPPTSSPVPHFPSVPSAVLTVHTIAQGKGGHPVRFWAKPSPPPRHTSPPIDKQPPDSRAAPRAVGHPARLVLVPVLFPSVRG